jgi:nucleotide-binding universal stress UspA family protein
MRIMTGPAPRLLVATDLSARCDRALDREWRAELVVLTVLEAAKAPDLVVAWALGNDDDSNHRLAREELERNLAGLDVRTSIRIARGDTTDAIREVAAQAECRLIVTGMARNEPFGRFLLGSTVERLARTLSQPLLVVPNRVHLPYRNILVATDFSDSSRRALDVAAKLFSVESTLTRYVRERSVDLAVLGTHGRTGMMNVLLGSTAARLLDWLPCDTMVVRGSPVTV